MKKIIFFFTLIFYQFALQANPVTIESAQKIAINFFKNFVPGKADYAISDVIVREENNVATFYVFNIASGGFIIIAADDASIPVLGYSEYGLYNENTLPLQMTGWLNDYSLQIKFIIDQKIGNHQTISAWNKILCNDFPAAKMAVAPLCTTNWAQDGNYNNIVESHTASGVIVGCLATAMAQIMKKWNFPASGTGTHIYTHATYGNLSVNFDTINYNWPQMPNYLSGTSTTDQINAIGTISYHCAVAVNTVFGVSISTAYVEDVPDALIEHFGYQNTAEFVAKKDYTNSDWINMLKMELDAGRPVLYAGFKGLSGHAFVFDGYNSADQFHVNWGWSGTYNGYYAVGSLNPGGGYGYTTDNMAVVRIQPPTGAPISYFKSGTLAPQVGEGVTFSDLSANSPDTWVWTFEGGSPATYTGQTPPEITYSIAGDYSVSLTVSNANGSDSKLKPAYVHVGGSPSAWIRQNSRLGRTSQFIRQFSIVDENVVWAVASSSLQSANPSNEYTITTDGGNTWTPKKIVFSGSENYGIANFHAFSDQVCYACMYPITKHGGCIIKTIDGGVTWSVQTSANFSTSWADFLYFFDVNNGVCVGDPPTTPNKFVIYTTSDGGATWTQLNPISLPGLATGETTAVGQYDAFGNTIWFGTNKGRILKSSDKGLTWTAIAATAIGLGTTNQITPVFKDADVGIALGRNTSTDDYAGVKKTINGGTTWSALTPSGYYISFPNIDFIPGTSSTWVNVSSGHGQGSSYSTDECSSFIDLDTGSVKYTGIKMFDINNGWAGGYNDSPSEGGIYKWVNPLTVGKNEPDLKNSSVLVFPTPTHGIINVQFSLFAAQKTLINVYNMIGEKIIEKEFDPSFEMTISLDISGNTPGIYLVTVRSGNEITSRRIMLID